MCGMVRRMVTPRRSDSRQRPAESARRVARRRRLDRPQLVFAALGTLAVCSLLTAAIGTVIVDAISQSDDEEPLVVDESADDLLASLRATAEANPTDPKALVALANYLANTGELDEAIDRYEQALAIDPADWRTRLNFARDLADGGKRPDAEVQFRRVLEAQRDDAEAHFYLAELYRAWQPARPAEAMAEYRRVVQLQPDSFYAQQAAEALAALGQPVATPPATPVVEGTP